MISQSGALGGSMAALAAGGGIGTTVYLTGFKGNNKEPETEQEKISVEDLKKIAEKPSIPTNNRKGSLGHELKSSQRLFDINDNLRWEIVLKTYKEPHDHKSIKSRKEGCSKQLRRNYSEFIGKTNQGKKEMVKRKCLFPKKVKEKLWNNGIKGGKIRTTRGDNVSRMMHHSVKDRIKKEYGTGIKKESDAIRNFCYLFPHKFTTEGKLTKLERVYSIYCII